MFTPKNRRAGLAVLAVASLGLVAAGCESDRGGRARAETPAGEMATPGQSGGIVQVDLANSGIQMQPTMLDAGTYTFQVRNSDQIEHSFRIEGNGINGGVGEAIPPGQTRSFVVTLEKGTYDVFCPTGNDKDKGMKRELTVKEANAAQNNSNDESRYQDREGND
jgi:uncharacterized cupredoxin-like copper-binding protein